MTNILALNHLDFLGRFETMDEDLQAVFARLELPIDDMEVRNVSENRTDFRAFYTPELVEAVAHIYDKDIRVFGYRFN